MVPVRDSALAADPDELCLGGSVGGAWGGELVLFPGKRLKPDERDRLTGRDFAAGPAEHLAKGVVAAARDNCLGSVAVVARADCALIKGWRGWG